MKTRNGFVSNSSSSSFMILATKEDIKNALEKVDKRFKKLIKSLISGGKNIKYKGQKLYKKIDTYYTDMFYEYVSEEEIEGDIEELCMDELETFFKILGEPSEIMDY